MMKKLIAIALVLVMACGMFAACGKNDGGAAADKKYEGTMEDAVNAIIEKSPVQFMGGLMPVDLSDTSEDGMFAIQSFTGLESGENLSDIAVYESMMGAQAFSLVLVRVNEGVDVKAVAQEMSDNIDTRKWVCVGADEKIVAGYGDVIMLIMLDTGLELKAQSYLDAFKEVCGEPDFTI